MREADILCQDACGAPANACRALLVPRDVTPPRLVVGQAVATVPMVPGATLDWETDGIDIAEICEIAITDNCTPDIRVITGITAVTSSDNTEVIEGVPGYFRSDVIVVDWTRFMVDRDLDTTTPRSYAFTFAGMDAYSNHATVGCEVRLVGADATCDGVDDDGNGETDEDFVGVPIECGQGQCTAVGEQRCVGGQIVEICEPGLPDHPDFEAACDGLDDDCDGAIDEDFPLGEICVAGEGICAQTGVRTCAPDGQGTICGAQPGLAGVEICDSLDNDCDGEIDDGFLVGRPCSQGLGACEDAGITHCAADGAGVICDAEPGTPRAEICDGADNDCDGATDEGFDLGTLCAEGQGECARPGTRICAADGQGTLCNVEPGTAVAEICNGRDDDCDGEVDNGFGVGPDCTVGLGICARQGQTVCAIDGISTTCSASPGVPVLESCDGLDNDCDGVIDNGFPVGEVCTQGVGLCRGVGQFVCAPDGVSATCNAERGDPQEETCNGLDDDCDGQVDNGFNAGLLCVVGTGACRATGVTQCTVDGAGVQCGAEAGNPAPERCNAIDDDCDGLIDNGFNLRAPCAEGLGNCRRDGTRICSPDGETAQCSVTAGEPHAEACNGEDDDCDGTIDNGFDADLDGVVDCLDGCPHDPDNDIDGDGICGDMDNCPAVVNPTQRDGDQDGLGDLCDTEDCDGLDNDDDGQIDEGFPDADLIGGADCHDFDGDGVTEEAGDCNDENPAIHSEAAEQWHDGIDSDCDGHPNPFDCDEAVPIVDVEVTDGCAHDLELRVSGACAGDCETTLHLVYELFNHGAEASPDGVGVALFGVDSQGQYVLLDHTTVAAVPSGRSSGGLVFELGPFEEIHRYPTLVLSVDDDGAGTGGLDECSEDNNRDQRETEPIECMPPYGCLETPPGYAVPVAAECQYQPERAFSPVIEWQRRNQEDVAPGSVQVMTMPVVGNLTDDNLDGRIDEHDVPDIIYVTFTGSSYDSNGYLRVISGDDGHIIWSASGVIGSGGVAIADADADGLPEIYAVTGAAQLVAFSHEGELLWTCPTANSGRYYWQYSPAVGDIEGDGFAEILLGRYVCDHQGTVIATTDLAHDFTPFFIDLDRDGTMEIVSGRGVSEADGSTRWVGGGRHAGVADFDGDGTPEVVTVEPDYGRVGLHAVDGTLLWSTDLPGRGGGSPTIADFDGDGAPEIGVAGAAFYVVFEGDGAIRWQQPIQDQSSQTTGSSVYDFDGDGAAEVVYADELTLWIYDGATGNVLVEETRHASGTLYEYPLIADVDRDGHVEIVVASNNYFFSGWNGITVLGDAFNRWVSGRPVWNQNAYYVTNINDDLTVPAEPEAHWIVGPNAFRQGAFQSQGAHIAPDLVATLSVSCRANCPQSERTLFHVENRGPNDVAAGIPWAVYGVDEQQARTLLVQGQLVTPLAAGRASEAQTLELDAVEVEGYANLVLVVDDDGTGAGLHNECNEDNNELNLPVYCQGGPPAPLVLAVAELPDGRFGEAYAYTVEHEGGVAPYHYDATGLPDGLALNGSTGVLSGTPQQAGLFTVILTVDTWDDQQAQQSLELTIEPPPLASNALAIDALPDGRTGVAYVYDIEIHGGLPPYALSAVDLPLGITLDWTSDPTVAPATARLSGEPGDYGVYAPLLAVDDAADHRIEATPTWTINPPEPVVTGGDSLPAGVSGHSGPNCGYCPR